MSTSKKGKDQRETISINNFRYADTIAERLFLSIDPDKLLGELERQITAVVED